MNRPVLTLTVAILAASACAACSRPRGPEGDSGGAPTRAVAAPPPAGAPAASAAATPPGSRAEGDTFEAALEPPATAQAGTAAAARVVLKARGPYHVNREYPTSFQPEPGAVPTFGAERVALGEGAERTPCTAHPEEACAVSAPLPFTPREAGEVRLAGTVAFSVCSAEQCLIKKVPLAATVAAR